MLTRRVDQETPCRPLGPAAFPADQERGNECPGADEGTRETRLKATGAGPGFKRQREEKVSAATGRPEPGGGASGSTLQCNNGGEAERR